MGFGNSLLAKIVLNPFFLSVDDIATLNLLVPLERVESKSRGYLGS